MLSVSVHKITVNLGRLGFELEQEPGKYLVSDQDPMPNSGPCASFSSDLVITQYCSKEKKFILDRAHCSIIRTFNFLFLIFCSVFHFLNLICMMYFISHIPVFSYFSCFFLTKF